MEAKNEELIKLMNREESFDVEFKESLAGLKPEDIVAFANSPLGGIILIGVKDSKTPDGKQVGIPVGCKISDDGKLNILNKAQSCRPPIYVEITPETINDVSIYKINIPSGQYKPYCTDGGTYRIRGDGQKNSIYPEELLTLFMENEKDKFIRSFQDATKDIERKLADTRNTLLDETEKMVSALKTMEKNFNDSLRDISSSAENAETSASSIESTVDNIEYTVDDIFEMLITVIYLVPRIEVKIDNLLGNESVNQETKVNWMPYVDEMIKKLFKNSKSRNIYLKQKLTRRVRLLSQIFPNADKEMLDLHCEQLIKKLLDDNVQA